MKECINNVNVSCLGLKRFSIEFRSWIIEYEPLDATTARALRFITQNNLAASFADKSQRRKTYSYRGKGSFDMIGRGTRTWLVVVIAAIRYRVAGAVANFTQDIATEALPVLTISSPQATSPALAGAAKLTPCQETGTLVDVCIDSGMSIFSQEITSIPPDPHGAVGPETLIAVTNKQIESLYKVNGVTVFGPTPLANMLSSLYPTRLFDPKIIYDVHRGRFVLVVLDKFADGFDVYESRILLAVSKSSVPKSTTSRDWYFHEIDALVDGLYWADYPGLAVDEEAIYITCNMYQAYSPGWFQKSLLWIVAKDPFYSGGFASVNPYDYIVEANDGYYGTHMPAMVRNSGGIAPNVGTYLVMYDGLANTDGTEFLSVIQIDSPLRNPTFRQEWIALGDIEDTSVELNDAPQLDLDLRYELIEVNDRRSLGAVWVGNQLWVVTTGRDPIGETAALWVKLNANGVDFPPTLADFGFITGEDIGRATSTFFPSVDVNSKGVAAFGFAASSPGMYPSAYAAIRTETDPPGTVRRPMLVKAGEAPYFINFGGTRNRWGDYSGMALDPSDEDCFWAFNEYAGRDTYTSDGGQFGSWKTAWARLCYPGKCKAVNSVCVNKKQCCSPTNKVCDGPPGSPKRCKVCLRRGAVCARTPQCCAGLKCKNKKCLP